MNFEHEISSLQKNYELTKDKRYKKAARDIEKIKNSLPAEYFQSDNSLADNKSVTDSVQIFPLTHKTPENAILDKDIGVISEQEKRKEVLMDDLNPLIEFHSIEFARRVPQEKSRKLFKSKVKNPKIVKWSLYEEASEREDNLQIDYLYWLHYDFDKRLGKNVPTKVNMRFKSQYDRSPTHYTGLTLPFTNGLISGIILQWNYDHPNIISEIGKSKKMKGDVFQSTIKALEEDYALNHLSVMKKKNKLYEPSHYIDHIRIATSIPSKLSFTYEKKVDSFDDYKDNTSVSTYTYHSDKDKFAHFKSSTTHYLSKDQTNLKPFYKDEVEKEEYLGIVKGMFGLIPTIQATEGYS